MPKTVYSHDRPVEGWSNWDTWATNLWAMNDYEFYKNRFMPMVRSVVKYANAGKLNREKAIEGFMRLARAAATVARRGGDHVTNRYVNWREIGEAWLSDALTNYKVHGT